MFGHEFFPAFFRLRVIKAGAGKKHATLPFSEKRLGLYQTLPMARVLRVSR